jgi:hypothetical protein
MRPPLKVLFVFVLTAALVLAAVPPALALRPVHTRKLADGVIYRVYVQKKRPRIRARVVSVRPSARPSLGVALAGGLLPGFERTSSMARRSRAIVAINGDYARPSGRPVMTFARSGRLAQTPLAPGANIGIGPGGLASYLGQPRLGTTLRRNVTGEEFGIGRVNAGPPSWSETALYTPSGGLLERPPLRACSARLLPRGAVNLAEAGGHLELRFEVGAVRCRFARMKKAGKVVVSGRNGSPAGRAVASLERGERVTVSWSLARSGALETLGGNPVIVRDGRIAVEHSSHPFFRRHPRTGVGMAANGSVLLVAVDGRRRRYSRGMTLRGFARFFRRLGAESALNLDGGGSTTMVIRGRVVNRPSDGRERPVSSSLLVLPRATGVSQRLAASTQTPAHEDLEVTPLARRLLPSPASVWDRVSSDPASTPGMAAATKDRSRLPPVLRDAARKLRESRRR